MKRQALLVIVSLLAASQLPGANGQATRPEKRTFRDPETREQHDARMAWWRDAKFGMFIHWGLYAISAEGEWFMRNKKIPVAEYKKLAAEFNPVKFDAGEWASLAQDAGMKYMVVTTKHHDGFAMYPSKASDDNLTDATPFKRDPVKELSLACPKHDVKFGTYYSVISDWGHPGGGCGGEKWDEAQKGDLDDYINKVSLPQVKELLSNYGPIAVMWFDGDGARTPDPDSVASRYATVLKLQPDLIVRGGAGSYPGDFSGYESHIPMKAPGGDWELCYTANGSWGYTKAKARPLENLLPVLIEAWAKGGNVLLNVGPDREGVIPPDSAAVLRQIGSWMKVNGEAVYGSKAGPFEYLPWGWATRKGDMLYLFVLQWPKDGELRIPMATPITKAWLLATPSKALDSELRNGITILKIPQQAPDAVASVIACRMAGEVPASHSLPVEGKVTASDNSPAAQAVAIGGKGVWGVEKPSAWIELDLGKPKTFSTARLATPSFKAATRDTMICTKGSKVILEAKQGDQWKKLFEQDLPMNGKNKEGRIVETFEPVTAQYVRATFTAGNPEEGATPQIRINNFELFPPL